eukprot:363673-Chlamydomonas_euryale.AAC.4
MCSRHIHRCESHTSASGQHAHTQKLFHTRPGPYPIPARTLHERHLSFLLTCPTPHKRIASAAHPRPPIFWPSLHPTPQAHTASAAPPGRAPAAAGATSARPAEAPCRAAERPGRAAEACTARRLRGGAVCARVPPPRPDAAPHPLHAHMEG